MLTPDQTRQNAVFEHLRHSIMTGALPAGGRLPPTRALAQEVGVARQTVVLAYERLAAEGYVRGRTGSGTYVATDLPDQAPERTATPRVAAIALSARGASLAEVPATAISRDATWDFAGGRAPGSRPVPQSGLGPLRRAGVETPGRRTLQLSAAPGSAGPARTDCSASGGHARPGRRPRVHRRHRRHPAGAAHGCGPSAGPRRHGLGGGPRLHRRPRRADCRRRQPGADPERS